MIQSYFKYLFKTYVKYWNYKISPFFSHIGRKKGKRNVQGVPQSQPAALPRHQEEEETDKSRQAQIEQMHEKH